LLLVIDVCGLIMEQRVRLLLDEEITRDDTQASLTASLTATRRDAETWLSEGPPSEEEANRRMAARKATLDELKAALAAKGDARDRASSSSGGSVPDSPDTGTHPPSDRRANLTSDEQTLLKCVEIGIPFFGSNAIIRGSVIRQIAIGDLVEKPNPNGVNVSGAHIKDALILGNVSTDVPLHFKSCSFEKTIYVSGARLPLLRFENCEFRPAWGAAVAADGLHLAGSFSLHDCVVEVRNANAAIELDNAVIGSHVSVQRTSIINPDGQCISGDRARIGSNLTLAGIRAKSGSAELSAVRFSIAEIGGRINLTEDSRVEALGGPAVTFDGTRVGEDVHAIGLVADAARAKDGTFRVSGADIGGQLVFAHCTIDNASSVAVMADRLRVHGSIMIGPQTKLQGVGDAGTLRLMGARVDGNVSFDNTAIFNATGPVVAAGNDGR
jgi:hypothetical protein